MALLPPWPAAATLAVGLANLVLVRYIWPWREEPGGRWFLVVNSLVENGLEHGGDVSFETPDSGGTRAIVRVPGLLTDGTQSDTDGESDDRTA